MKNPNKPEGTIMKTLSKLALTITIAMPIFGMDKQVIPMTAPEHTQRDIHAMLAAIQLVTVPAHNDTNAAPEAPRMENSSSARRLQCPKISCPSCTPERTSKICGCMAYSSTVVPAALVGDAILYPCLNCLAVYVNCQAGTQYCTKYDDQTSYTVNDLLCMFTRNACKTSCKKYYQCCANSNSL
jgi:hypothetical protein